MSAVSVVMPVYNAERYVAEAVESILAQTFRDFELLIIDDGSTDDTPEILRRFAEGDSRIRLVVRPNVGLVRTLNEMIGMARGEFVARMDADDVSMPDRFRLQVDYLRDHPEVVVAGSRVLVIDPEGDALFEYDMVLCHEVIDHGHLTRMVCSICHPTAMIRADVLREIGGYRTEFDHCEDYDLWLRLAEVGKLVNLPEVLLKYRVHSSSRARSTHPASLNLYELKAIRDACSRRGLPEPEAAPEETETPQEADHRKVWAWWALSSGNVRTARKHALRSLWLRPFSVGSWRVVACALRGY